MNMTPCSMKSSTLFEVDIWFTVQIGYFMMYRTFHTKTESVLRSPSQLPSTEMGLESVDLKISQGIRA